MHSPHFDCYLLVLPSHLCPVLSLFSNFLLWFFPILTPFCSVFLLSLLTCGTLFCYLSSSPYPLSDDLFSSSFLGCTALLYCSLVPHSAKTLINDNTEVLLVVSTNVICYHGIWKPDSYLEAKSLAKLQCKAGTIAREFHWQTDFHGFSKNIRKAILGSEKIRKNWG